MSVAATIISRRASALMFRRHQRVVVRRTSKLDGPSPLPSPPLLEGSLTAAAAGAGTFTLTLRAPVLVGRLVAGDCLRVDALDLVVASTATAEPNPAPTGPDDAHRVVVTLAAAIGAPIAAGTVVTPTWAADKTVPARVQDAAARAQAIGGGMVVIRNFYVTVAAIDLGFEPSLDDLVFFPGELKARAIVGVSADKVRDAPALYRLEVL